jgi:CheY-like chemotaxis protein
MTHPMSRGTILVVDDNVDIPGFAKRLLEIAGYTVITATDGPTGMTGCVPTSSIKPPSSCCSLT